MQQRLEASITFWACVIILNVALYADGPTNLIWAWLIITLVAWVRYFLS